MKHNILVTGASGFVGGAVIERLQADGEKSVIAVVRGEGRLSAPVSIARIETFSPQTQWQPHLLNVDTVIHCGARVHVMNDTEADPLGAFRRVNVEGTINFARQAAAANVRRFIFISSIKVNGEGTLPGNPYTAADVPAPADPYGISKSEAEQSLKQIAQMTGMEVVIIRPVLVYGPGVKANFLSMMRWLDKGVPLPFGAINNRRSLVSIDNLVDLIVICIDHPQAANQTFLVSDGEDLSTTALLSRMARSLGKPARLIPVPSWILECGAKALGKATLSQRLCGSLQVDIEKTRALLNWTPPVSVDDALDKTARHFRMNPTK
ncbi:UNVERIFIED_ORG: UDP-glucose 4-epimerase [Pseudomonas lini]|uniref:SDR family oxidoreductase n=1 Tax=Pseudomonas viciae TaxID=2505979 RepID=A0A4P7PDY2_9PSED|nr:SDR family oxidoreductase [Pseudomonas viciae]QBZ88759.1 SDR family oxidoreductase [Pseudomonas viciae]UZE88105.1 SDR family oxidoreductase [Pseudomonas viciae]WGO95085.1 SDR family oxidoreductase [Pseudomonas viciae]